MRGQIGYSGRSSDNSTYSLLRIERLWRRLRRQYLFAEFLLRSLKGGKKNLQKRKARFTISFSRYMHHVECDFYLHNKVVAASRLASREELECSTLRAQDSRVRCSCPRL
jgi:hypothetical protein